jgi:acetyl esterase/lipase
VSVHGGGYVYGDKNLYRFCCMSLAQRGFAVVNFSYRLAPEHRFPAQLEDVNSAMQFVVRHAAQYFIDTHNVFFVGDSAGAQMASKYLAAVTNPSYALLLGLEIPAFDIRACALNCGFYIPDLHKDKMLIKCYLQKPSQVDAKEMDIAANITAEFPPSFVMTSNKDFLRERAKPFVELLTSKGVEAECPAASRPAMWVFRELCRPRWHAAFRFLFQGPRISTAAHNCCDRPDARW